MSSNGTMFTPFLERTKIKYSSLYAFHSTTGQGCLGSKMWSLTVLIPNVPSRLVLGFRKHQDTTPGAGKHSLGCGKAEAGDFRASPHSVVHGVAHRGVRNKMSVVPGLLTRLRPWTLGHPGRWESRKSQEWKRPASWGRGLGCGKGDLRLSSAVIVLRLAAVMAGSADEYSMGGLGSGSIGEGLLHVSHVRGRWKRQSLVPNSLLVVHCGKWMSTVSTSQGDLEIDCLLQGEMSVMGSLLAKPSRPQASLEWWTLFWACVTTGHISLSGKCSTCSRPGICQEGVRRLPSQVCTNEFWGHNLFWLPSIQTWFTVPCIVNLKTVLITELFL